MTAETINLHLASTRPPEGLRFPTVSYGIATSTNTADPTAMIAAAESALYEAKNLGRNRIVTARPGT